MWTCVYISVTEWFIAGWKWCILGFVKRICWQSINISLDNGLVTASHYLKHWWPRSDVNIRHRTMFNWCIILVIHSQTIWAFKIIFSVYWFFEFFWLVSLQTIWVNDIGSINVDGFNLEVLWCGVFDKKQDIIHNIFDRLDCWQIQYLCGLTKTNSVHMYYLPTITDIQCECLFFIHFSIIWFSLW